MSIFNLLPSFHNKQISWSVPPTAIYAHACTSFALRNAKELNLSSSQLATELAQTLSTSEHIQSVFITEPGYVNVLFKSKAFLHAFDLEMHQGNVSVEYVSANPTGPLHIGHAKQAVIGSVLANVYKAKGYHVTNTYYYNDCGNQIDLLVSSVIFHMFKEKQHLCPPNPAYYQGTYIGELAELFCENDSIEDIGKVIVNTIKKWQFKTLAQLNIAFDEFISEAELYASGMVEDVLSSWKEKGILYQKDGATFTDINDQPVVVQKSNGTYTYFVPDVALHKKKLSQYDKVINVQGVDHLYTKDKVLFGIKNIDMSPDKVHYVLHKMVHVYKDGKLIKQSKRAGTAVDIDGLFDTVDADSLKFYLLSNSAEKELKIHLEKLQNLDETNPAWYVKMTYAKYYSLINKNLYEHQDFCELPQTLHKALTKILYIDDTLESIIQYNSPHLIYQLLMEMAVILNHTYASIPKLHGLTQEEKLPYCYWLPKILNFYGKLMNIANIEVVQNI